MKKTDLIDNLRNNKLLRETYDKIDDRVERERIKRMTDNVFTDFGNALGPLLEALQSPEVKEQLMIHLSTLLTGSNA